MNSAGNSATATTTGHTSAAAACRESASFATLLHLGGTRRWNCKDFIRTRHRRWTESIERLTTAVLTLSEIVVELLKLAQLATLVLIILVEGLVGLLRALEFTSVTFASHFQGVESIFHLDKLRLELVLTLM